MSIAIRLKAEEIEALSVFMCVFRLASECVLTHTHLRSDTVYLQSLRPAPHTVGHFQSQNYVKKLRPRHDITV